MHHAAKGGATPVQRQMGRGIGRRPPLALHHLAVEIHHHHVFHAHGLVGHAAGFDRHQPTAPVNRADVSPGKGDQSVTRQIHVCLKCLLFKLLHFRLP
ncbi:hypothetical protein D3C76_1610270 [compost metagenome]